MRQGVFLPPFGELADPRVLAELAVLAERRGFDGFFVWDHVLRREGEMPIADPWIALSAVACATSTIRIGAMVTPLARRRPWMVARQAITLDHLSAGRLTLGVGLGNDRGRELSAFGEVTDDKARAALLDESLDVLSKLFTAEPIDHDGPAHHLSNVRFLPAPVQHPRPPIWVGGVWPNRAPWRRAARYDGAFPVGDAPLTPAAAAELLTIVADHRPADAGPFDLVVQGRHGASMGGEPADFAALAAAGVTWWLEALLPSDDLAIVRAWIDAGPPA